MNKSLSFNKPQQQQKETGLPSPADICGIPGCTNDTGIVRIKVSSPRGIEYRNASDVLLNTNKPYVLKEGYNFISWCTRCHECFAIGARNKKAKLKMEGEHYYYV